MIRFSLNLPTGRRLHIQLVKGRNGPDETPLFPTLGSILRVKKGSKLSRYLRFIFENRKVKRLLGTNLLALFIAATFIPSSPVAADNTTINQAAISPIVLTTEVSIQFPLKHVKITQNFHFYHPGIDLDGITGDPIKPLMMGKIKSIQYSRFGYGNAVLIEHGSGIDSFYSHLSSVNVSKGQQVDKNTIIGAVGATGRAFGDHLHLEVRENGVPINPLTILPNNPISVI